MQRFVQLSKCAKNLGLLGNYCITCWLFTTYLAKSLFVLPGAKLAQAAFKGDPTGEGIGL